MEEGAKMNNTVTESTRFNWKNHWTDTLKLKYFFIANVVFLAGGLCSLIVGIWLYCSKNNFIELTPTAYSALSAAGLCVFTGVTIFIITAVGYLGVVWTNRALLLSYISFICLLILVHGIARTTGFLHKDEARDNLRHSMLRNINTTTVYTKIGREIKLSVSWDHLQRELECCGADKYTDWYYSVHWPISQYVPDSCCVPSRYAEGQDMGGCGKITEDGDMFYQEGCFPKFADWLYHHIILVNYVTSILFVVEVVIFILTIFVMRVVFRLIPTKPKRTRRAVEDPLDETHERIRLNSMDRIGDAAQDDQESVHSTQALA